jgi:hypothetical protein
MSGDDNALDGHALFCREKFAYALALMDGRTQMDSSDWELSGTVAAISDWCRLRAQNTLENSRRDAALERGKWRGFEHYESEITRSAIAHEDLKRILTWAVKKLSETGEKRMKKRELTIAAAGRDRSRLTEAMLRGVEIGLIKGDEAEWVLL